jgi:plastocyanin
MTASRARFALTALVAAMSITAAARAANTTVNVTNNQFTDTTSGTSTSTIFTGETVIWNFLEGTHSTTSGTCNGSICTPNGDWDSGLIAAPGVFAVTFSGPGVFHYYCIVHGASMQGDVQVFNIPPPPTTCTPDATTLCLNNGRFQVQVQWVDYFGNTGFGQVVPNFSADSGLFWFFSANNWELMVKVLNGCPVNQHYWVFGAAATSVQYTITVSDTQTGQIKQYFNPLNTQAAALTDTSAFATCP